MNYNFKNRNKGFTLVETILYLALFVLLIFSISSFYNIVVSSRNHNQIILEVKDQGTKAITIITQKIRNATAINSPSRGTNANTLSLAMSDSGSNPTVFSVSGGVLYITEGSGSPVALTNNKISVNNLSFSNLSRSSTPGVIKVRLTLTNLLQSQGSNYSSNFYGSASIR